jgi:hypothetical protein
MRVKYLTENDVESFHKDGFVLSPGMFEPAEIAVLQEAVAVDSGLKVNAIGLDDGAGGKSRLTIWYEPGDDTYGIFARVARVVDGVEKLLGREPYFYHSKVMLKEPLVGGAWSWHQDYGYWYKDGFLYPDMLSVLIAVDRANRENGCLQVLRGSHRLGRIDHSFVGDQTGAEQQRLELAFGEFERVHCEMAPGDVLFFHGNTLHGSDQNRSENPRFSLISCYAASDNQPKGPRRDFVNTLPIDRVPDSAIKDTGVVALRSSHSFQTPKDQS